MRSHYRSALLLALVAGLLGCGDSQSDLDKCFDSKASLWSPKATDNRYEGNERYWNAISQCEDQHR